MLGLDTLLQAAGRRSCNLQFVQFGSCNFPAGAAAPPGTSALVVTAVAAEMRGVKWWREVKGGTRQDPGSIG